MSYFPFFIDLSDKTVLMVGGGNVAYRKTQALSEFGAEIKVVAIESCDELKEFAKNHPNVRLHHRAFVREDLEAIDFCIAATNNPELNELISKMCSDRRILVNVVDVKELCGFIFPAYVKKKEVVIGISSGGKSPLIAQEVRKGIEDKLPEDIGQYADFLGNVRQEVRDNVTGEINRRACYKELLEYYRINGEKPDKHTIACIINQYKES